MKKLYYLAALITCHVSTAIKAQNTLFINGANVHNFNNTFHVNGDVMINAGTLNNEGSIYVRNAGNNGDFHINTNGTSQGNGNYYIEHDWINDGTFNANNSLVTLDGSNQLITGSQITTFHNLTLTGTGIKTQTIDANIDNTGTLNLTTVELATGTNTMHVMNPSPTAVVTNAPTTTTTGFVSSSGNGSLQWDANSTQDYLFPVGSSIAPARYRPVVLKPTSNTPASYSVRFVNNDPNIDGFSRASNDGTICKTDSLFYHDIELVNGNTAADVTITYVSPNDGSWNGIAHWHNTNTLWTNTGANITGTLGSFNTVKRTGWAFTDPGYPFMLIENAPSAPVINGKNILCIGENEVTFTASGGSGTYSWTFPNGVTIVSANSDSSQITVNWGTGAGTIIVTSQSPSGQCKSSPAMLNIGVFPPPTAYGYSDTNNVLPGMPIQFVDTSVGGVVAWGWNFSDGNQSNIQNPYHIYYAPGTYPVTLTVTDTNGCVDTAVIYITILDNVLIPNVFSPNGDGINDVFRILGGGFEEFKLSIYNRWGELMFETDNVNIGWDGRTSAGLEASPGTYYFILVAKSKSKDYSTTGYLTLLK